MLHWLHSRPFVPYLYRAISIFFHNAASRPIAEVFEIYKSIMKAAIFYFCFHHGGFPTYALVLDAGKQVCSHRSPPPLACNTCMEPGAGCLITIQPCTSL